MYICRPFQNHGFENIFLFEVGNLNDFIIGFVGLKDGDHEFSFQIDQKFFDSFENSLISSGDIQVRLDLCKKPGMLECDFNHSGTVYSICDRCGQPLDFEIEGSNQIIFKFSDLLESNSDEIVYISHNEYELNVAPYFYEFISLSLPSKNVHPEGACDESILKLLDELNTKEPMESDPRWDALKNLKKEDK